MRLNFYTSECGWSLVEGITDKSVYHSPFEIRSTNWTGRTPKQCINQFIIPKYSLIKSSQSLGDLASSHVSKVFPRCLTLVLPSKLDPVPCFSFCCFFSREGMSRLTRSFVAIIIYLSITFFLSVFVCVFCHPLTIRLKICLKIKGCTVHKHIQLLIHIHMYDCACVFKHVC